MAEDMRRFGPAPTYQQDTGQQSAGQGALNFAPPAPEVADIPGRARAVTPTTVGYDPSAFTVTPQQTVAGQVGNITTGKDASGLIKQAERRSLQKSNARGLINSSMAIGEAQEAVIAQALPIAQQDAQTHAQAATNTTNAVNAAQYAKMQADNTANLRGAELSTNVNLANADATNRMTLTDKETDRALQLADKEFARSMGTANIDATTRLQLAAMDHDSRMNLAQVDRQTRVELASIENIFRVLLQNNQDLASMYNQVSTNIANISMANLDANAKRAAMQSQINILKETLAAKQNASTAFPSGTKSWLQGLGLDNYFKDLRFD